MIAKRCKQAAEGVELGARVWNVNLLREWGKKKKLTADTIGTWWLDKESQNVLMFSTVRAGSC